MRKNNSKRAYQLMKDLTTAKKRGSYLYPTLASEMPYRRPRDTELWTECCPELYNYKANGDPSVLNCPQVHTEDDHPILRKDVEAAYQSLKKGKSNGVDHIPADLVQAGGEAVITALTTTCKKI